MSLRVAVAGASGRMGALVCAAVEAAGDMSLVARINRGGSVKQAVEAGVQVSSLTYQTAFVPMPTTTRTHALDSYNTCMIENVHDINVLFAVAPRLSDK